MLTVCTNDSKQAKTTTRTAQEQQNTIRAKTVAPKTQCPHTILIGDIYLEDLELKQLVYLKSTKNNEANEEAEETSTMVNGEDESSEVSLKCDDCSVKQNLWLCLRGDCFYVGCGNSNNSNKHSVLHANEAHHPLSINLSTKLVWCEICNDKIDLAWNNPPFYFKPLRESNSHRAGTLTANDSHSHRVSMSEDSAVNEAEADDDNTELANFLDRDSVLIVRESRNENSVELASRVGQLGLANLGNTCYMNAALQAMSNCYLFTSYFLECPQYIQHIQLLNGSTRVNKQEFFSTSVSYNYMKLMRQLWLENVTRSTTQDNVSSVTPNELLYAVKSINPMFRGYQQHDSQEFLIFLIEQIHDELKRPRFVPKSTKNSNENTKKSEEAGQEKRRVPPSPSGESCSEESSSSSSKSIRMSKSTTSISTTTSQITDEEDSVDTYETCDEEEFNRNKPAQANGNESQQLGRAYTK
jgi:ubiquitin carboxyl-terminal hydrolase 20/33